MKGKRSPAQIEAADSARKRWAHTAKLGHVAMMQQQLSRIMGCSMSTQRTKDAAQAIFLLLPELRESLKERNDG